MPGNGDCSPIKQLEEPPSCDSPGNVIVIRTLSAGGERRTPPPPAVMVELRPQTSLGLNQSSDAHVTAPTRRSA